MTIPPAEDGEWGTDIARARGIMAEEATRCQELEAPGGAGAVAGQSLPDPSASASKAYESYESDEMTSESGTILSLETWCIP